MDLYTYCIPYDDGAAPNPYWGVCTLVICKPAIRRTAKVGDWIVGTGAKYARLGDGTTKDMRGRVVYAMKVTKKMTMAEYDAHTQVRLEKKIPDWRNSDPRRRLGDSIYDFSRGQPKQRESVHNEGNIKTDLSGNDALLSAHFFYFGDNAVLLPSGLREIAQNRQGHRRRMNEPFIDEFVKWIECLGHAPGAVVGDPLLDVFANDSTCRWCASGRAETDEDDDESIAPGY